jgi:hypothetical protein
VPLDRELIDAVNDLDDHELSRLMILARTRLTKAGAMVAADPQVTVRSQFVRCGKTGCTRCPHGPYWYAYWREDGKRRSRYVGRLLKEGT